MNLLELLVVLRSKPSHRSPAFENNCSLALPYPIPTWSCLTKKKGVETKYCLIIYFIFILLKLKSYEYFITTQSS